MKFNFKLLFMVLTMLFAFSASATIATVDPNTVVKNQEISTVYEFKLATQTTVKDILTLNIQEIETKLGRKMNWREKYTFLYAKRQFQKADKKGQLAQAVAEAKAEKIALGIVLVLLVVVVVIILLLQAIISGLRSFRI